MYADTGQSRSTRAQILALTAATLMGCGVPSGDQMPDYRVAQAYRVMSAWAADGLPSLRGCRPEDWLYIESDEETPAEYAGHAEWYEPEGVGVIRISPTRDTTGQIFYHEVAHILDWCTGRSPKEPNSDHDGYQGPVWGPDGALAHSLECRRLRPE